MDIQDTSAAIYSEAKSEYTKQLVFNFQPVLLRFFLDRYAEAKASSAVLAKTKSSLGEFQESLSQIPEWNLDKVQRETTLLMQNVHCDYVEDLITAVFIAHTKILSAIRLNAKPRQKIRITVPKPDHFMHRCLSECSRLLWSNIYLFNDSTTSLDRQKNMNDVNRFLEEGIVQAIRNLLPVKSILRDSLQEDDDDDIHTLGESNESQSATKETAIVEAPEVQTPQVEAPQVEAPQVEAPQVQTLQVEAPPLETPQLEAPRIEAPVLNLDTVSNVPVTLQPGSSEISSDNDVKVIKSVKVPTTVSVEKQDSLQSASQQGTLIVDTEKSVGFTGIDSVFGSMGDAELRPMVDEASDEFKIIGDLESLGNDEYDDINEDNQPPLPLGSDDYETL